MNFTARVVVLVMCLASSRPALTGDFSVLETRAVAASGPVGALTFAGPEPLLLLVDSVRVLAYDVNRSGPARTLLTAEEPITSIAVSGDGAGLLTGTSNGHLRYASLADSQPRDFGAGHRGRITAVALSAFPALGASAAADKQVILWDPKQGIQLRTLRNPSNKTVQFLAFSRDARRLIGATSASHIIEWDPQAGTIVRQWSDPDPMIQAAVLSPEGDFLGIASEQMALLKQNPFHEAHPSQIYRENRIKIYDLSKGTVVKTIDGLSGEIGALSFSPDSRFLAATRHGQVKTHVSIYDLERGVEVAVFPAANRVRAVSFDSEGQWLGMAGAEGGIRLMRVDGVQPLQRTANLAGGKYVLSQDNRAPLLDFTSPTPLAIIDFEAMTGSHETGRSCAGYLEAQIAGGLNIILVERSQLEQQILKEQNFGLSARTDPATAAALGRVVGARKMILGRVSQAGSTYTVTVRLVDVETARIDGVGEVQCLRCQPEDLPGAIAMLRSVLVAKAREGR